MSVRQLGPDDWQVLRRLRLAALADAPEAFGSTHVRELAFDAAEWRRRAAGSGWFVADSAAVADRGEGVAPATAGERVTELGIVAGIAEADLPTHQRQLVAMWVAPPARGTGVAEELIDAVVGWAREQGATELTLGVADGNDRARSLYLRVGFVPTGKRFPLHSDSSREMEILSRPL